MVEAANSDKPQPANRPVVEPLVAFVRAAGMGFRPARLTLALAAFILCVAWGNLLDWAWCAADRGVSGAEVSVPARGLLEIGGVPEAAGDQRGVYEVWWPMQRVAMAGALVAAFDLEFFGAWPGGDGALQALPFSAEELRGRDLGRLIGLVGCLQLSVQAMGWLCTAHWLYAIFFLGGGLIVWSWLGGAGICRMHVAEYALGARLRAWPALLYARDHLWSGFVWAPLIPVIFVLVVGVFMAFGGMLMSIPLLGDLVGGVLFIALGMGLLAAYALVVSVGAASQYWPSIAANGYDAMESVVHSTAYLQSRPLKTIAYLAASCLLAGVGWLLMSVLVWVGLVVTHTFVGLGTDLFTDRSPVAGMVDQSEGSKLDAIWPMGGPGGIGAAPTHERTFGDGLSGVLVSAWVRVFSGLSGAAAAAVWFACSTAAYLALRRDVDEVSRDDVDRTGIVSEELPDA